MTYIPIEIADLEDVGTGTPADGQALVYNSSSGLWEPADQTASSPLTTKGDLYTYGTDDARLPVGADGQVLTADSAQTLGVKWSAVSAASTFVGAKAKMTAATTPTLTANTDTNVAWENEVYDTDAFIDVAGANPSRFTIPSGQAGKYLVSGAVSLYPTGGSGLLQVRIAVNGVFTHVAATVTAAKAAFHALSFAVPLDLAVSDYVQIRVRSDNGTTDLVDSPEWSYAGVTKL